MNVKPRNVHSILVTGSSGFVGRNLLAKLKAMKGLEIHGFDLKQDITELYESLRHCELIYHLAGINRPTHEREFHEGNAEFTKTICDFLLSNGLSPKIVFTSSIQAEMDNPYGRSKLEAEKMLKDYSEASKADCAVYRLKNLFGKWCRPNYNAVTATFCYNISHGLPVQISDPEKMMELTYIDDVTEAFVHELATDRKGYYLANPLKFYRVSLGDLHDKINKYNEMRTSLLLPDFSDSFERALYATYLSYLDEDHFDYPLQIKSDERGSLAEFIKTAHSGQIFISNTKPGVTRGNHYHHTKTEKFMVVQGQAMIRFRHIEKSEIHSYHVKGEEYRVVDIPPGYTHSIQNVGTENLATLFWASEMYDPENPDTYFLEV